MIEAIKNEILRKKKLKNFSEQNIEFLPENFKDFRISKITVHGRFQPPLHINHFYTYISIAFQIAQKVIILITNPDLSEDQVKEASHRASLENNPFTYEERVEIFTDFFTKIGIPKERYLFKPFKITDEKEWNKVLDKNTVNLINTYGDWSKKKLSTFRKLGYKTIHSSFPKLANISGTSIRKILKSNLNIVEKKEFLIKNGLMPESVDKVLEIVNKK